MVNGVRMRGIQAFPRRHEVVLGIESLATGETSGAKRYRPSNRVADGGARRSSGLQVVAGTWSAGCTSPYPFGTCDATCGGGCGDE